MRKKTYHWLSFATGGVREQRATSAYGSVPHKLVKSSLDWHHVLSKITDLILE